jgi:hypothetical protein
MDFLSAYEAMVEAGGTPLHAARVQAMRRDFEERAGAFGPDDAWFEVRSRAFWDDALTSQGFGAEVSRGLPEAARAWLEPLSRAHRGLFRAEEGGDATWTLHDEWSGAEFVVDQPADPGLCEALRAATLFDGRVIGRAEPLAVVLLPGAVFHPADATEPIMRVLDDARQKQLKSTRLFDTLLRMERNLRSHSRVKASYAYRL